jgi:hypothetical protein
MARRPNPAVSRGAGILAERSVPAPAWGPGGLTAYEPSLGQRIAGLLFGDERPSPERRRLVEGLLGSNSAGDTGVGLLDLTPAGAPLAIDRAQREARGGNYGGAALEAIGAIPVPAFKAADEVGSAASALTKAAETLPTPGLLGNADVGAEVLRKRAAQMELPAKDRLKPNGQDPVFDTSPAAYDRTMTRVKQEEQFSKNPNIPEGKKGPAGDRTRPIIENADAIAEVLANRARGGIGTDYQYFYRTGPMYEALERYMSPAEADQFMGRFAGAFAGTSPRTNTEQNTLNAANLMFKDAQGIPFERNALTGELGNDKGYPMMDMHRDLTRRFLDGTAERGTNPKPDNFRENTRGNLQGVTADTHSIRSTLSALNEVAPGQVPPEWLVPGAKETYAQTGLLDVSNMIDDSLKGQAVGGKKSQVEYGVMADIPRRMAEKLGVSPADAQSLQWFTDGAQTGLVSAPKTIPTLVNERINVTAQALGMTPETVFKLWSEGKIPLMSVGGAAVGAGLLGQEPAQEGFQ